MWTVIPAYSRRRRRAFCAAVICVALTAPHAVGAQECTSPTRETRAVILNKLRPAVASDLRTRVAFKVERVRTCGPWAFVLATPQRPGGEEIRWSGTPCQGDTSHLVGALLRQKAGVWRLVDYALCPSDVAWADWPEKYSAPAAVFEE